MFFKHQTDKTETRGATLLSGGDPWPRTSVFINNTKLSKYDKKISKTTPTVNTKISAYDTVVLSLVTSDDSVTVKPHDKTNKNPY